MKTNKFIFIAIAIFLLLNIRANANEKIYEVPYISQLSDTNEKYKYIDESACAPTSIAMLIKYYYENSNIDMPEIYHAGMQGYNYDGPAIGYRNVSWQAGYWSRDPGIDHPEIGNDFKPLYPIDGYSGSRSLSTRQNYFKNFWNINSELISKEQIKEHLLNKGPLLGHVYGKGNVNYGHFLVITGYNDNNTISINDDIIFVNDPYKWPPKNIEGNNRAFSYNEFFLKGEDGNAWFRDALAIYPDTNIPEMERKNTTIVSNGNDTTNGNPSINKFQVDDINDKLDNNQNKYSWRFRYDKRGGWHYPIENGHSARWTPNLITDGEYDIIVKYLADTSSGEVTYKVHGVNGEVLCSQTINQYKDKDLILFSNIGHSIYLTNGSYVVAEKISPNSKLGVIEFRFKQHKKKYSWFFNGSTIESWQTKNFSNTLPIAPNQYGWLELTPASDPTNEPLAPKPDPQIISPYLGLTVNPKDTNGVNTPDEAIELIQFYGRNNSSGQTGAIYIKTDINKKYTATERKTFTFPNDNRWHLIQINARDIDGWKEANRIEEIRIDLVETVNANNPGKIYIDYIRLKKRKALKQSADSSVTWHPDGTILRRKDAAPSQ